MSDLPASYIVWDSRSDQIHAPALAFSLLGVIALDLPNDLWQDFLFFVDEARVAESQGDALKRYHFLRGSMLSLFAHLNAFFDLLIASRKQDSDFQKYNKSEIAKRRSSLDWPRCAHGQFVVIFTDFVQKTQKITLPEIDWSIKPLRNILAHSNGAREVTVVDLYQLNIEHLFNAAFTFQAWIVQATKLCSIEYEIDTAKMVSDIIAIYTKDSAPLPQRF